MTLNRFGPMPTPSITAPVISVTARRTKRTDANGWIGTLNGMIGFTSLDKREERTLLKYLQMNASDTTNTPHSDKENTMKIRTRYTSLVDVFWRSLAV